MTDGGISATPLAIGTPMMAVSRSRPTRGRRLFARSCAWLAAALVGLVVAPGLAPAASGDTLGVYAGAGDPAAVKAFGDRLARDIPLAHDFLDKRSWTTMSEVGWVTQRWGGFQNRMVLTVPMLPDTGGTLAAGAAGQYNTYFRTLAQRLVAGGQGRSVLRIGPEFNGKWYRWTIDVPDGGRLYAQFWRQIVATMRAVPGAEFKFDWSANAGSAWTNNGSGQLEAEDAWPGDDVVDYVGLDVYDHSWAPQGADPVARWNEVLGVKNGLRWHAAFAAAHGKQMTFPEWALAARDDGHGGGDNPYFIERMHEWLNSHDVAYSLYFESGDPNGMYAVFGGRFPNAARRFVELFGYGTSGTTGTTEATEGPGDPPMTTDRMAWAKDASAMGVPGVREPAGLRVKRARIRGRRLEVVAGISPRASGSVDVRLRAAGRTRRFVTTVDGRRGRVRLDKPISSAQARRPGVVTLRYGGDDDTHSQAVRLRMSSRRARAVAPRRLSSP